MPVSASDADRCDDITVAEEIADRLSRPLLGEPGFAEAVAKQSHEQAFAHVVANWASGAAGILCGRDDVQAAAERDRFSDEITVCSQRLKQSQFLDPDERIVTIWMDNEVVVLFIK
jgi:hypothetical protein